MAQKVSVTITDDIDGSDGAETVAFAYQGRSYEIDLSDKNRERLEKALAPFIEKARRSGAPARRRSNSTGVDVAAVKAWARSVGKDYPQRGRLPQALIDEFRAAGH